MILPDVMLMNTTVVSADGTVRRVTLAVLLPEVRPPVVLVNTSVDATVARVTGAELDVGPAVILAGTRTSGASVDGAVWTKRSLDILRDIWCCGTPQRVTMPTLTGGFRVKVEERTLTQYVALTSTIVQLCGRG